MNTLLVCAILIAAHVRAQEFDLPRRVIHRAPFGNDTALVGNSTTLFLPSTSLENTKSPITIATTTIATNKDAVSTPSGSLPSASDRPPSQPPPSGDSSSDNPNPTGHADGACDDSVMTYFGSVYPTVYLTVTETYDVTLSAANATMTDKETLITPSSPSACHSTVVPIDNPGQAVATILATIEMSVTEISAASDPVSTFSTISVPVNGTRAFTGDRKQTTDGAPLPPVREPFATSSNSRGNDLRPHPNPTVPSPGDDLLYGPDETHVDSKPIIVESTIYATAPYTSTVIVTKKTPVPVVPRSQDPPVTFQAPPPSPPLNPPADDGRQSIPQQTGGPNIGNQVNTLVQVPSPNLTGFLETVIRSIILQQPSPTPDIVPQTTLNNVPIAIRQSSIIIGGSAVPIPIGRDEAVVTEGGAVFTIRPAEIVADATTVAFGSLNPQGAISVAPTRITAAPGVVVAVAGSTAIVDGTTFRLDASFSTVITVSGERISIGPSGIGLASTTIAVGQVTEAPQIVETVGDVTFTIDGTNVIISGTRYGIGNDSPTITTEFGGQRVSIGPGGIGFDSTTVSPSSAHTSTRSSSGAGSTSTGSADQNGAPGDGDSSSDGESSAYRVPGYTLVASLLALLMAL